MSLERHKVLTDRQAAPFRGERRQKNEKDFKNRIYHKTDDRSSKIRQKNAACLSYLVKMKERQQKTSGALPYTGNEQENDKQSNIHDTKTRLICQGKSGATSPIVNACPAFTLLAKLLPCPALKSLVLGGVNRQCLSLRRQGAPNPGPPELITVFRSFFDTFSIFKY